MQLVIDTHLDSSAHMRLASKLLMDCAALQDADDAQRGASYPGPGATISNHVHITPANAPMSSGVLAGDVVVLEPSAAEVFKHNAAPTGTSNVLPFPTLPAPSTATAPASVSSAAPVAASASTISSPNTATAAVTAGAASPTFAPATAIELDSAGVPWDARIHAANKAKKADNSWKLKKGVDKALAVALTAELKAANLSRAVASVAGIPSPTVNADIAARIAAAGGAAPAVAPPVGLPPVQPGPMSLPPVQGGAVATIPAATLPAPNQPAPLPLPPVAPAGTLSPLERFQLMMRKISAALGEQRVTQEQVDAAWRGLGLAQLQLAITRPELIPSIEAALGLA